jgi:flagellar protein FliJ
MSGLDTLVRLHRWRVDEKQRQVATLLRMLADLEARIEGLAADMKREGEVAGANPEFAPAFPAYVAGARQRQAVLRKSCAEVNTQIEAAREELNAAFRELKKYEIAAENRAKRTNMALARKVRAELDEIGADGYRRRQREARSS